MEEHRPKKLLNQVRACPACVEASRGGAWVRGAIRLRPYSYRTKQVCVGWIKRCLPFRSVRHPSETEVLKLAEFTGDFRYVYVAHQALALAQPMMSQYPLSFWAVA